MKITTVAVVALLSVPLLGQVYQPQPQAQPQPPNAPRVRRAADPFAEASPGLGRNLTIHLAGEVAKDLKVDVAITGTGPQWMIDQIVGEDGTALTCEYHLEEMDGAFRVSYSIGVRVAVPTSRPAGPGVPGQPQQTSITYRDVVVRGNVACRLGEPVAILRNGSQKVQLTVEDPAATENQPSPAKPPK